VFGEKKGGGGIEFDKYDNIPVKVSGSNAGEIKPIALFSEARLTESLFDNLRRCGYERPTPIQKYSIPIVVSGRDLMACAQTGSGKTCAFMVPCLESLLRKGPPPASGRRPSPCGLVLAPTRELAAQIHAESVKFSFKTGIRTCIIYGGAAMNEQKRELDDGCDILVATPGRLTDMFDRKFVSLNLVHFFILDEADRMLDMGFEPQVRQIVEQTDMVQRKADRQSMMFSATFSKEVQIMATDFLHDYLFITVGRVGAASELVTQKVVYAEEHSHKVRSMEKALKDYLPEGGLAVVFVETKKGADTLESDLYAKGVQVAAIHGDRSQAEREAALAAFKSGHNPVLVATDVVGRGLDIDNIALVVNFDMPKQIDDYVHRIGRTGRAGRTGVAVALINQRCMYLSDLRDLLSEAKQEVPSWYDDLCKNGPKRGVPRQGRHAFAIDAREQDPTGAFAGAPKSAPVVQRQGDSFGMTGQEDAW
jgi:ATP-dependent RNA helicase DDX3X